MTAIDIVQHQFEAYNAHDLPRFLQVYSDAVRVFRPPSPEPTLSGKAAFAEFYATQRFNRPGLRAELLNRMVLGALVVDHERIWGVGEQPFEMAVVYEVNDGRIQTVWAFAAQ